MTALDAVIEKVRKLRALSTSTNEHEAAAAAAAADRLIQEHRLREAQLEVAGATSSQARVDTHALDLYGSRITTWKIRLACALAKLHGCVAFSGRGGTGDVGVFLVGQPGDVACVRFLYEWLTTQIDELAAARAGHGQRWIRSYRLGCVDGIAAAMLKAQALARRAVQASTLVFIDERQKAAEDALEARFGRLRTEVRDADTAGSDAYAEGIHDGSGLSTAKQLHQP